MDDHVRAVALSDACDATDHVMRLQVASASSQYHPKLTQSNEGVQACHLVFANGLDERLIDDTEHRDDVLPLGLEKDE